MAQRNAPARNVPQNRVQPAPAVRRISPAARPGARVAPAVVRGGGGRTYVMPTGDARADYNAAAEAFGGNVILFPSTLVITSDVLATQNSVVFDIREANTNNDIPLAINDGFLARHMGIFVARYATAAGNGVFAAVLHTFANALVFTAANELIAMPTLYNGRVSITVNDIEYARGIDMRSFMRVDGEAQQGLAVSTAVGAGVVPNSAWEENKCFLPLVPMMVFNGPSRNITTVNLPASVNFAAAAGFENRLVLMYRGLIAQNGGRMRNQ